MLLLPLCLSLLLFFSIHKNRLCLEQSLIFFGIFKEFTDVRVAHSSAALRQWKMLLELTGFQATMYPSPVSLL